MLRLGTALCATTLGVALFAACSSDESGDTGAGATGAGGSSAETTGSAGSPATSSAEASSATSASSGQGGSGGGATGDTWSNFAMGFFATYCIECHGAGDTMRDYSTIDDVKLEQAEIRCGVATT